MERAGYRECIAAINEATGGKVWLTIKDCAAALGINRQTVRRRFNVPKEGISNSELARRVTAFDAKSRTDIYK